MAFENFALWYAKSLTDNGPDDADLLIKSGENNIKLVYCVPSQFAKRVTDTSSALAEDKTSPDSGTAAAMVELKFTQERDTAPTTNVLETLIKMFFNKTDDEVFRKARYGLTTSDNPELDCTPTSTAGYKLEGFQQIPNQNEPALLTYVVRLGFVGDHNRLGAYA